MKETRKTIIVATLAAMLLKLDAHWPIDRARALIACLQSTVAARAP